VFNKAPTIDTLNSEGWWDIFLLKVLIRRVKQVSIEITRRSKPDMRKFMKLGKDEERSAD
jgi:hypothetical protein